MKKIPAKELAVLKKEVQEQLGVKIPVDKLLKKDKYYGQSKKYRNKFWQICYLIKKGEL